MLRHHGYYDPEHTDTFVFNETFADAAGVSIFLFLPGRSKKMKKQSKRSKSKQISQIMFRNEIVKLLIAIAVWLGTLFLIASPKTLEFRKTIFFTIGIKVLVSAVILYFAFLHKSAKGLPIWGKICMILGAVLLFTAFLPVKVSIVMSVLILVLQSVLFAFTLTTICNPAGPGVVMMLTMLKLLSVDSEGWSFVNNPGGFHFWAVALVGMAIVGFAFYEMLRRGFIKLKDNRTSGRVSIVLMAGVIAFIGTWCSVSNLNYALDTSAPQTYQTEIVGKRISSGKNTTYYLKAQAPEGELDFDVSENLYYLVETGDGGKLLKYQGAFSDPYYVLQLDNIE